MPTEPAAERIAEQTAASPQGASAGTGITAG